MIDFDVLGKRIATCRNTKGLTQDQLSELIGVSSGFIGQIERGEAKTPLDRIPQIAKALGVEESDLVSQLNSSHERSFESELLFYARLMSDEGVKQLLNFAKFLCEEEKKSN